MDYIPLAATLLAILLYLNTLEANFAYDDSRAILKNPDLLPETPLWNLVYDDFWGTPLTHSGSHKSYRPLCVLTFRLNYYLGALDPWGYHLGNVICHALTTFVYTVLVRALLGSDLGTLTAGLTFAAHPIHTEAVAGVVGRADILACLLVVLTFICYRKYVSQRSSDSPGSRWLTAGLVLVLTTAAMLTKEQALTVLAVCATYDVIVVHRASLRHVCTLEIFTQPKFRPALEGLIFLAVCGSCLLGFRIYFMGNKPPEFAPSDNPASDSDSLTARVLTYNYLPSLNFWLLLCPKVLSFDWSMEAVPLVEGLGDHRNIFTLIFYASMFYLVFHVLNSIQKDDATSDFDQTKYFKRKYSAMASKTYTNGTGISGSSFSHSNGSSKSRSYDENNGGKIMASPPVSIRQVDIIVISLALIVFPFIPATNLFFYVGFVVAERILYIPSMGFCLLVGLGVQVLYTHAKEGPRRKLVLAGLVLLVVSYSAKTVLRNRDWQTEERLYSAGIGVNPAKAWGNLANIFNDKHEVDKAEQAYRNALTYRPNMADVHYNLGILLQNQNRFEEAVESYKKAIQFRPKLSVAHLNLGIITSQIGDHELAKKIYSRCADLDTSGLKDPRLHDNTKISCMFNHGRLLMDQDKLQESLEMFNKALERKPDHYAPQSLYNMIGEVYFKMGQLAEAEKWYLEALKSKHDHLPAHLTMSKLNQAKSQWEEAEKWLDKAKQHNPTDTAIDFHRAQLYATMHRFTDSIAIFEKLLPAMNHDFDIVFNAANVYREAEMKQKAEELYLSAVKLKPKEPSAWMNLGAMLHINAKYPQAEQAYLKALELKPNDKVTTENLQRLRNLMNVNKQR
ncbi:protein O-mannosyl-transferase TMTC2-like [Physella acuta]|uniref:protein O-mannosyl-transferase TMTC2-like n=1 Tax=Physella acuta TaxID=109671 RepID=UPI0027DC4C8E|nr:protein O-mannosyl-transferase TMTC2-like [Physella acuta]